MAERIILVGYMGSGKTTVGKALASELKMRFYDLDWYIESRMHRTVAQLFRERGEEGFRTIEHNMLHEVAEFEDVRKAASARQNARRNALLYQRTVVES